MVLMPYKNLIDLDNATLGRIVVLQHIRWSLGKLSPSQDHGMKIAISANLFPLQLTDMHAQ
jgi:hypothetical protein